MVVVLDGVLSGVVVLPLVRILVLFVVVSFSWSFSGRVGWLWFAGLVDVLVVVGGVALGRDRASLGWGLLLGLFFLGLPVVSFFFGLVLGRWR